MNKKIRVYIFIVMTSGLFGSAFGMEQQELVTRQSVSNTINYLLHKDFISAIAVNDYIVPVTSFSQALKKEALLTQACLQKMKNMVRRKINAINNRHREIMKKECTQVYMIDVSDMRNQTSHTLRDFCSKRMDITYSRSLKSSHVPSAYMKKYIFIHPVSLLGLKRDQLPTNDIVAHNLGFALRNKFEELFEKGESFAIELYSKGNVSDWFKVTNNFGYIRPIKSTLLSLKNTLSAEESTLFHARDLDYNPLDIQGIKFAGYSLFTGMVFIAALLVNGLMRSA